MILIVGAGNVGLHFAQGIRERIRCRVQILSSQARKKESYPDPWVKWITDPLKINRSPKLCLLCVPDSAIASVAESLCGFLSPETIVVHTSGTTPRGVLEPFFPNNGVFYPLQTFTAGHYVAWHWLPIFIDASNTQADIFLYEFALKLTGNVEAANDAQREQIHLSAVFANNFTNHCIRIAMDLLEENGMDGNMLIPLIEATFQKYNYLRPSKAQTGPALRGDQRTMERHGELLKAHPKWAELYRLLSEDIARMRPGS